jgi:hypothetical protein
MDLVSMSLPGPYTVVWLIAFVLFIFEIIVSISYDEEDSFRKIWLIVLMYFSYCQLWIYLVIKSFYIEYIKKEKHVWDKTVRFDLAAEKETK